MEGLLKDGVCINNALQNNGDAVFIAAISKATHDHKVILNHQTKMRISTEALKKLKANLVLLLPTTTEGRIGTGGTAISVTISFSGLSPRFSNSQSCRKMKKKSKILSTKLQ